MTTIQRTNMTIIMMHTVADMCGMTNGRRDTRWHRATGHEASALTIALTI